MKKGARYSCRDTRESNFQPAVHPFLTDFVFEMNRIEQPMAQQTGGITPTFRFGARSEAKPYRELPG